MRGIERARDLNREPQRLIERQRRSQSRASVSPSRYRMTRYAVPVLADVIERADVRVVSCEIVRASRSKRSRNCVRREGFGQDLDGDVAIEPRVARAVDLAHAAGAEGG